MANLVRRFFKHRTGHFYFTLGTSHHTETMEELMTYISLYETDKYPFGKIWCRPLKMWTEVVDGRPRSVEEIPSDELRNKTTDYLKTLLQPPRV